MSQDTALLLRVTEINDKLLNDDNYYYTLCLTRRLVQKHYP